MPGGDFSTVFDGTVSDPEGSGTFSVALVSGQNYTMTLGNNGNISSVGGLSGTAGARSFVDWNISYNAVPEPYPSGVGRSQAAAAVRATLRKVFQFHGKSSSIR